MRITHTHKIVWSQSYQEYSLRVLSLHHWLLLITVLNHPQSTCKSFYTSEKQPSWRRALSDTNISKHWKLDGWVFEWLPIYLTRDLVNVDDTVTTCIYVKINLTTWSSTEIYVIWIERIYTKQSQVNKEKRKTIYLEFYNLQAQFFLSKWDILLSVVHCLLLIIHHCHF